MVERLKLISGRIHWSLVAKASALGLIWYLLPFWLFLLAAFYFYFVPVFRSMRFLFPFLILLLLVSPILLEESLGLAGLLGAAFFVLLGVKDLILAERRSSYEIFILILVFLGFLSFFSHFENWLGLGVVLGSLFLSLILFFLSKNLINYEDSVLEELTFSSSTVLTASGLIAFLVWQTIWGFLFLPFNYIYQTIALLVFTFVVLELVLAYLAKNLTPKKILTQFSILFVFLVLALTSTRWEL